jgi:amino acid adenylation domain-containing protein
LNAAKLHAHFLSLGIELVAEDGRLRVRARPGTLTAEVQEKIVANKTALLELLADRPAAPSTDLTRMSSQSGSPPLSLFQERLWVLHRLDPEDTAYNLVTLWASPEPANIARQSRLVREVVRRHEILRSTFRDDGGMPEIHLLPADAVHIAVHDLRVIGEVEQQEMIAAAIAAATHRPFDLASEPPVRFGLYQLDRDRLAIMVAAHHIACDVWSLSILRKELMASPSQELAQPEPAFQYYDFAAWQRRRLKEEAVASDLQWWAGNLAGVPQLCTFPADLPGAERGSGSALTFRWSKELSDGIHKMVHAAGATVYMALLAACAVVLQTYTRSDDIVLGSPMGARERSEFETIVGPFVNLLVLRINLQEASTFADALACARDAVLDAHAHGDVPIEMLIERLKPVRSLRRSPLFQVAVVQHNASDEPIGPIHGGGAVHDLTWYVRDVAGELESSLEYRDDLYLGDTISQIAAHLEIVLRAAVANPRVKLSEISMLTAEERLQVVERFNATDVALDLPTFPARFERQAAISSANCAVRCNGVEFTYGALNGRANQLARHLRSMGVGPRVTVGVCLDRSFELLVALLAISKAGGCYVPLDPDFPAQRLTFMLADSGATTLVTAGAIVAKLQIPEGVQIVNFAAIARVLDDLHPADLDPADLDPAASTEDPAYVIYTSGSTGKPKGVAVSHRALSNFLGAMQIAPGMSSTDVLAAVTTISFDIAALELYLPLAVGARIELVPRETAANGAGLALLLAASGATLVQATPVTWRMLVEAGWRGPPGFRALCGGEALPLDLADLLLDRSEELWNLYGPTETTIWSTAGRVVSGAAPVSIGRPIANTRVYILDREGRAAPLGVPGEICIGGAGVAIGYHNRPELTAERFISDPFSPQQGGRLYRTGDLGRWARDGLLHHLGRIDSQVKLRGARIEPGEIEAALCSHPSVRQAVVAALEAEPGNVRLVAYVTCQFGEDPTSSELRSHLRRQLPEYMVPSLIVTLDSIPLTQNGKINRTALPNPFENSLRDPSKHEPPAPGMEQVMAEIWQEILKVERVGAEDNFFELGGDSLRTLRVAAMLENRTGSRIDPRALFLQTLRQIAASAKRTAALTQERA